MVLRARPRCYRLVAVSFAILLSERHPRQQVDPFGLLPCRHASVVVHTTSGEFLGSDLVECGRCGIVVALHDLYFGMMPGDAFKTPR